MGKKSGRGRRKARLGYDSPWKKKRGEGEVAKRFHTRKLNPLGCQGWQNPIILRGATWPPLGEQGRIVKTLTR